MSSTRHTKVGAEFRQERYASSRAFNRGLRANLVARRCETVRDPAIRELIYFLAEVSWRELSLAAHPTCTAFPSWPWKREDARLDDKPLERVAREMMPSGADDQKRVEAVADFLAKFALDPSIDATKDFPRQLPGWLDALDAVHRMFALQAAESVARTEVSESVFDALGFLKAQGGCVLIEGEYRLGKSFSAQAWCLQNLGCSRYVQLNARFDEAGFYRDLAKALGTAATSVRKTPEIRDRVEACLRHRHLVLVIDEAQHLFSQSVRPKAAPARVDWLMTALLNQGVSVALVASKNFSRLLDLTNRQIITWGGRQFRGRIRLHKQLPDALSIPDLQAIAGKLLPESTEAIRMFLAGHALASDGHVAAIESAVSRAQYLAHRQGRRIVTFEDIESACEETSSSPQSHPRRRPLSQAHELLAKPSRHHRHPVAT